ncbi:hypothetical protein A11S_334 [Micavibrio aeruginosavorus EPB]|uniref:Uncharacterized protein n=2 Tax=Micavibrio aeruginosavorus TaxID=349221 RepID=M4VVE1_9BACT|nr:hypothetical protein A11S_334 [Micavibrio aeruginosavorus EPB]
MLLSRKKSAPGPGLGCYNDPMTLTLINNPGFETLEKAGFTRFQFQRLDALFLRAAQTKVLNARFVDCDFEEGVMTFSYAKTNAHAPMFTFVIRQVGPRQVMYELHQEGKGRPFKSGLFDRVYEKLELAIDAILPPPL